MDHLPELLAAMYRAPAGRSLSGTVRYDTDHDLRRVRMQLRGAIVLVAGVGSTAERRDPTLRVWVDGDRSRVEQFGQVVLRDATSVVQYTPGQGAFRTPVRRAEPFESPQWLWAPRRLIDAIDIDGARAGERLGRPVWQVTGRPDGADRPGLFAMVLDGDRYAFDVDQATGVVLAMRISTDDGQLLDDIEWTAFEADAPIDPEMFELRLPDERIRSANGLRLDALAREGVDVSGVDPDDDEAVAGLLGQRRPWRGTLGPLAHVVATGDPPVDVAAAEASIERAFRDVGERDGDRLVYVQAGAGLAPFLDQARSRVDAELRVARVRFSSASEALANVEVVRRDGGGNVMTAPMRAVVEDGAWKVERSAFASLLRMAGVHCPPPG